MDDLRVGRLVIPAADLSWTASRSSGPGGQNVNKVASKVDLRFDLAHSNALSPAAKARLEQIARTKLDRDGRLVITSQATRDQSKNLEDAREKLAELVRRALVVPKKRRPTKPTKGSKERRLKEKKSRAETKKGRGVSWD